MWNIVKTNSRGKYVDAILPEHPRADSRGRVYLHHAMMENKLGRLLTPGEIVHHKNGNPKDNRECNLEIMTMPDHSSLHSSARGLTVVEVTCSFCGLVFTKEKRCVKTKRVFCSRSHCASFYGRGADRKRDIPHGTYGRYRKGCRCVDCRSANNVRMKRYLNGRRSRSVGRASVLKTDNP